MISPRPPSSTVSPGLSIDFPGSFSNAGPISRRPGRARDYETCLSQQSCMTTRQAGLLESRPVHMRAPSLSGRPQSRTRNARGPSRTCSLTKSPGTAGESESTAEMGDLAAILVNRGESAAKKSATGIRLKQAQNGRVLWRRRSARITPPASSPAGHRLRGEDSNCGPSG